MKNDIDFDELDKAVGSVLGNQVATATSVNTPAEVADSTTSSGQSVSVAPQLEVEESIPEVSVTPATDVDVVKATSARPTSPALKRSSGRFMDVVHPSTDMKKPAVVTSKRSEPGLKSLLSDTKSIVDTPATSKADTPVDHSPIKLDDYEPQPVGDLSTTDDDTAVDSGPSWPDPLDVDKLTNSKRQSTDVNSAEATVTGKSTVAEDPTSSDDLVSGPFLSDQKVEKRPLGAFTDEANSSNSSEDDVKSDNQTEDTVDDQILVETEVVAEQTELGVADKSTEVPAELQANAVIAEAEEVTDEKGSSTSEDLDDTSSKSGEPTITDKAGDGNDKDDTSRDSEERAETQTDDQPTDPAARLANQSIPPQYQVQTTDSDKVKTNTVFDTQNYHQPLKTPVVKSRVKKATGVVGLVVLLVLVGVAIGYAYYIYRAGGF